MLAKVNAGDIVGLDGVAVDVEVDITKKGFGSFRIVGLASKATDEAKHRVKAAIDNSELPFPKYKITVNLAPADLPKSSPAFDLPIAVGVLLAGKLLPHRAELDQSLFIGELSLDGTLRSTPGVLPLTLFAREQELKKVFVPAVNATEAAIVEGIQVVPVNSLNHLLHHLNGLTPIQPVETVDVESLTQTIDFDFDMADVRGQEFAKRGLEIAAAGGHNVHLAGPPGAGKTLLARTLPSIMPPLTASEALEVSKIYSITHHLNPNQPLISQRPFRAPHHTTSRIGLIGGGQQISPGEVSMAHCGILFMDELPEFPRSVLESLRQPMEDGTVTISRARGSLTFPSRLMLIAASNPCPCGYHGSKKKKCLCSPSKISWYKKRVSGPMMDRIDLHIDVPEVEVEKLVNEQAQSERERRASSKIRQDVIAAREKQRQRFGGEKISYNAEMGAKQIKKFVPLTKELESFMTEATRAHGLSARGYHKVLKVARTIADLAGVDDIDKTHLSEALQFRLAKN